PRTGVDEVVALHPLDVVVAVRVGDDVVTGAAHEGVDARAALDAVVARVAPDGVVALVAAQTVVARRAVHLDMLVAVPRPGAVGEPREPRLTLALGQRRLLRDVQDRVLQREDI